MINSTDPKVLLFRASWAHFGGIRVIFKGLYDHLLKGSEIFFNFSYP